jgi:hypothetical protein
MFFSIVKWVFISLTLIFLVHHLYMFLMNTLTVPKIKDLVNKPTQQYQSIFDTLEQAKNANAPSANANAQSANANAAATLVSANAMPSMTDELSSFLSELKKGPVQAKQQQAQQHSQMPTQAQQQQQQNDVTDINSLPMYSPY